MLDFQQLIWTFIFHIFNAIILFIILRWLLFKPVKKFLNSREDRFRDRIADLDKRQKKIEELEMYYRSRINEAKDEAKVVIDQANERAQEHLKDAQIKAREQAQLMLERGRKQLDSERKAAMDELKVKTAVLAVEISSKILEKNITLEDNQTIIDEFLERVE